MLGGLLDRLVRRRREDAAKFEADIDRMSAEDRRVAGQSVDDFQADAFVKEHLGGLDPGPHGGDERLPLD
jgi:hypothetical protein